MKILMINSVCGIRSTGRICTDLSAALEEQGHQVKIAYGRETVPEQYQKYAVRIGSDLDVKCHGLQSRIFDNTGFGSKKATEKFLQWADTYNPNVLHLHNIHGYYIHIGLLFDWIKKRPDIKIIWTLHDCWTFTGHCSHFDFVGCDRWKTGCYDCPQKKEYPKSLLFDNSRNNWLNKKDLFTGIKHMTIVTPSHWLAGLVKQSFLKEYPVEVIHNGIDLDVFKPTPSDFRQKHGLENKKIILGVASAWDRRKGFYDFIELSKILDDNYQIVLVGLSQKQISELPENILGIERTNSTKELAEIYTAADVFFNPTYEDNYPTVNLEAQACGTPVITYHTGGSVESVPKENIVSKGNFETLLNGLDIFNTMLKIENYGYRGYLNMYARGIKHD